MAWCTKCNGEIDALAIVCSHCGHDFRSKPGTYANERAGIEYSKLADIALLVSAIAAGLGCFGAVYVFIVTISNGDLFRALVLCPIGFFLQLGMLVLFLRAQGSTSSGGK